MTVDFSLEIMETKECDTHFSSAKRRELFIVNPISVATIIQELRGN